MWTEAYLGYDAAAQESSITIALFSIFRKVFRDLEDTNGLGLHVVQDLLLRIRDNISAEQNSEERPKSFGCFISMSRRYEKGHEPFT
jgi:hypothetical protein